MLAAALLLLLAACSPGPKSTDGLALHQSVTVGDRTLEIWEDARITPEKRAAMWGGPKDQVPDVRRALVRLLGREGEMLAERRLDCELGQIAEPALPQAGGTVFGVGDDCSIGGGEFAGLVTRFLPPPGDRLTFETYRDPDSGEKAELTLVTARRIAWHLAVPGVAEVVHEMSSHPDFDDPRFKAMKPREPAPDGIPWVVDYLTYRWDAAAGDWVRHIRTERNAEWTADRPFAEGSAFPSP